MKKNFSTKEDVQFFIPPTSRLIFFTLLSFGGYSLYWFVQNFIAIEKSRKARGKKTRTFFWGVFSAFTAGILFKELELIKKGNSDNGFKINSILLGLIYFIFAFFSGFILMYPIVFISTALIFHNQLIKYSKEGKYAYKHSAFKKSELVFTLVCFVLGVLRLFNYISSIYLSTLY